MSIRRILITLWQRRGVVLRGLLCWCIGCLILASDEVNSYDTRIQVRGDQLASSEIILVSFRATDVRKPMTDRIFGETQELSESSYWNEDQWHRLLTILLKNTPRAIGVTIVFPEEVYPRPSGEALRTFQDPRITWGALSAENQRTVRSPFSRYGAVKIGNVDVIHDEDGMVRRFSSPSPLIPTLIEGVTGKNLTEGWIPHFINFRGSARVFAQFYAADILSGKVPSAALKNKIILVGGEKIATGRYLTPIGSLNRAQLFAHIGDNLLENRWISRGQFYTYALFLFFITVLTVSLISQYPPSIAFAMILWLCLLVTAMSVWVFDSHALWFPVVSPVMMIAVTWIIFVGYQAHRMERETWKLVQEKKYLTEVEQLKNNFVSLISHDLKTPIAKIQSISDRLLGQNLPLEAEIDVKSLRSSSEELHRYIHSILKLLRVESRDLKLNREVCDINLLIEQAIQQLQPLAQEKSQTLTTIQEPLFSIEADTTLIREVLVNLIENAIKYTPVGGTIVISSREVTDFVQVEVVDSGHGIPPAELEQVWQKFVRGKDQEMKTKGTGLGLYLVKFFIELHGGSVSMESEVHKGTKVSFTLPLENESEAS